MQISSLSLDKTVKLTVYAVHSMMTARSLLGFWKSPKIFFEDFRW